MSTAIKVENLSKIYRLGEIGTGTISRDLERWVKMNVLGKEDPFLKIGESNDRSLKGGSDLVYSLQDLNFEIQQGDAVGIIGRNGAGKSTLLKILSRVTTPTTGKVNIKGRVASLLEVGTGFHPELTGRENIYLNGAILGMRKREIDRKFDEIVDFSGVERYIDTPVKRYSSGMYVRLAFAVAAHLESEILIVDEVLAVGDAEFQKKCLGKMGDISKGEGRTVLFVSHNLAAVKTLCNSILYLKNGKIVKEGGVEDTIKEYLSENQNIIKKGIIPRSFKRKFQNGGAYIDSIQILNSQGLYTNNFYFGEEFKIQIEFTAEKDLENSTIQLIIASQMGENCLTINDCQEGVYQFRNYKKGKHKVEVLVSTKLLPLGFTISAFISTMNGTPVDFVEHIIPFTVSSIGIKQGSDYPWGPVYGFIEKNGTWNYL